MADRTGSLGPCDCKVGRVLDRRELDGLAGRMAERWRTGDASLRTLESEFNVAVLRAASREAGRSTLDGEAENLYRLLTGDDVTSGMRVQTRRRLEGDGLDVDRVESDFVSHQTVHKHFRDCLGVEREPDDRDPVAVAEERIRALQSRLEVVVGDALDGLRDDDALALGEYDVYSEIVATCNDCGARRELGQLLDEGGCECADDTRSQTGE